MNLADLDALVKMLQDPDLRAAMAHPDWEDAYQAIVDVQTEREDNFFDLSDDQQFLHILDLINFSVDAGGKLWAEESGLEPYAWENGRWSNWFDGEDEGPTSGEEDGPE